MVFEHAYRLQKKGFNVYITFKHVEPDFKPSVFPHSEDLLIVDYGSLVDVDIVIATYWSTAYDLSDFNASYYLYFCQCDERLFYPTDDINRFWVEQTYSILQLPIVASADFLASKLKAEFASESFYVPYGIDLSKFHPVERPERQKKRVLIEGAGKPAFKRVDDAFKVVQGISNIEVWYVTYDGFVAPNWNPDKVFKKVPHHEMPRIYQSCDILLKLSEVESFGLPNLEMMACGGAVITSNFTGHEEYAIDGLNCFVVDIGDVDFARNRVKELIQDPVVIQKFASNGIQTAFKRNWEELKPDFADQLNALILRIPEGNAKEIFPRLAKISMAYRKFLSANNQLSYLNDWRDTIIQRENRFIYRIARRLDSILNHKSS